MKNKTVIELIEKMPFNLQLFADGSDDAGASDGGEGGEGEESGGDSGKTFSQAELNAIVQRRVAQIEGKYADYETLKDKASKYDAAEEAGKSELQKAQESMQKYKKQYEDLVAQNTIRDMRAKVSAETGVPAELLTAATEADCKAQAAAIQKYAGKSADDYPDVRDNGESGASKPKSAKASFERFMKANF